MNFIKKNKVLFIVLVATLLISGYLLLLVFNGWSEMRKSDKQVAEKRKQIDELNSKSPAPLDENLQRINSDVTQLQKKLVDIYPRFGAPYKKALDAFAKALGTTSSALYEKWRETYEKGYREKENENLILTKFLRQYENDKVTKAEKAFKNAIVKETMEEINESNLYSCLMESLGLPRQIDAISCKQFIKDMQTSVCEYLEEKKTDKDVTVIFQSPKVKKLSFEKYDEAMPRPEEVPYIFKHWRMINDIAKRLKASKVEYLEDLSRDNLIKGNVYKKDYLLFSYTLKIKGTMGAIRKFYNQMLNAYKDYKIYRIKSLELISEDEAKKIVESSTVSNRSGRSRRGRGRGRSRGRRNNDDDITSADEIKAKLYVPVLGVDDTVEAIIKFDYIIYIGNEMKRGSRK